MLLSTPSCTSGTAADQYFVLYWRVRLTKTAADQYFVVYWRKRPIRSATDQYFVLYWISRVQTSGISTSRSCYYRHSHRLVLAVLLLSSSSPILPSRFWRHRPDVTVNVIVADLTWRFCCHASPSPSCLLLLPSSWCPSWRRRTVVVVVQTSSRRCRPVRHRLSAVVTSSPLFGRFHDLRYFNVKDKWTLGLD